MVSLCQYHLPTKLKYLIPKENPHLVRLIQKGILRNTRINKYKSQHHKNPTKRVIKCFKCDKVGHITPNCKNHKINALSDKDYYSEISEDDSSSSDNSKNNKSASEKDLTSND